MEMISEEMEERLGRHSVKMPKHSKALFGQMPISQLASAWIRSTRRSCDDPANTLLSRSMPIKSESYEDGEALALERYIVIRAVDRRCKMLDGNGRAQARQLAWVQAKDPLNEYKSEAFVFGDGNFAYRNLQLFSARQRARRPLKKCFQDVH